MARSGYDKTLERILDAAEQQFGRPVARATAPGGKGRSSYRLHFEDRSVIATLRPNFRRTHLEAFVLQSLHPLCGDMPECLGVDGEILFQSDLGGRRLNQAIVEFDPFDQIDIADQAVASIFRIQSAARQTQLHTIMPHLGANVDWVENFVSAVDALQDYSMGLPKGFDAEAASEIVARTGDQFVKWDCRSGNAAIGEDERVRWFDFEYSGLRHGAEDLAWLIGDEAWPIEPGTMQEIVRDNYDSGTDEDIEDYLDYLAAYLTFHSVQRFKLIVKEAKKRGWLTKERVRKYDDAGVHPEFAAHICEVGRFYAERNKSTAALARNFDEAAGTFRAILDEGRKVARA